MSSIVISLIFTSMGPSGEAAGAAGQEPCSWGGLLPAHPALCSRHQMQVASSVPRHQKRQLGNAAGVPCCSSAPLSHHGCGWMQLSIRDPPPLGHTVPPGSSTPFPTEVSGRNTSPMSHLPLFRWIYPRKSRFPWKQCLGSSISPSCSRGPACAPHPPVPPWLMPSSGQRSNPTATAPGRGLVWPLHGLAAHNSPFVCLPWTNLRRETGLRRSRN